MRALKPYLLLTGNTTTKKYRLFISIKLEDNMEIESMKQNGFLNYHGKKCRLLEIKIVRAAGVSNPHPKHLLYAFTVGARSNEDCILVKRVAGSGITLPDPQQGGIGNYDDPDGDN